MADLLGIARTGVVAANAGLKTTSHNIANANSEGYHRQRVELYAGASGSFSTNRFGLGVQVGDVTRVQDEIVLRQRRDAGSELHSLQQFETLGTQVSEMFGESGYHLDESMDAFFASVRESADNPHSIPMRTVVIQQAEEMTARFNNLDTRLARMETDLSPLIAAEVEGINAIAAEITEINRQLNNSVGSENDMFDRRDKLLDDLASRVQIDTRYGQHGEVSVSIAKGQTIVDGIHQNELFTTADPSNARLLRVNFDNRGDGVDITGAIKGGSLGGILDDSVSLLRDTRASIGQLAASMVTEVNSIHRQSIDVDGALGEDFFAPVEPRAQSDYDNTGNAIVGVTVQNGTELQNKSYKLDFDGSNWTVTDTADGTQLSTGPLPQVIDGVELSLDSGAANAGDSFFISPSVGAAQEMRVALDDPRKLAMAQPVRAIENTDNGGDATVSRIAVTDVNNPALQNSVMIEFGDPANQFSIVDANTGTVLAPPAAYNSGDPITYNGWEVAVTGNPQAGDRITIDGNADGLASQNLGQLSDLQTDKVMAGGNASIEEMYGALVGGVGSKVRTAVNNAESQGRVHQILTDRLENTVGVSLDEEATKMLQYQQMFQASARIIQTVQTTFDTLIRSF